MILKFLSGTRQALFSIAGAAPCLLFLCVKKRAVLRHAEMGYQGKMNGHNRFLQKLVVSFASEFVGNTDLDAGYAIVGCDVVSALVSAIEVADGLVFKVGPGNHGIKRGAFG